jgi:radical SAM superfamily enzyme YgiQ (UPF0313 family)
MTDPIRKGLLLYPEFPDSSFWSYRHIMPMVGAKAAFPPLGLLTFAALMPPEWSFELLDLNVHRPPNDVLRARIAAADAVFVSAMSVQKPSLVAVIAEASQGLTTPWVLGGPYPSSYRDHILQARTPSDEILRRGLDVLAWGEGGQWVSAIDGLLRGERQCHSDADPVLLIPDAIAAQAPGSRVALNDRSIFKELGSSPVPRWDLLDIRDYRSMMMQTTVGCRFRCDFCDIIQFNGGFTRPRMLESVRDDLDAILSLGYRGGVFTVDDNFVGNPQAIESILRVMIEFQRAHDYPFSFYTQASLDLGSPKLAHLLPLMKAAGFAEVFLGIENPDPAALARMNKKQNLKVGIGETVGALQRSGIEVMAGFIFGGDEDTVDTAGAIADFATQVAIPTAMAGMLTPIPHTPLTERLRNEGRLRESEFSGNNTNDVVQFVPQHMTGVEMQAGYYSILERLFSPAAMYQRSGALIDRIEPHIFRGGGSTRWVDLRAALRSLWRQGIVGRARREYFGLLWKGVRRDASRFREAGRSAAQMRRLLTASADDGRSPIGAAEQPLVSALVDRAREAVIRVEREQPLAAVDAWTASVKEKIDSRLATPSDLQSLYRRSEEYFDRQRRLHRFPGAFLVKAFNLAIKGLHYEVVMRNIMRLSAAGDPPSQPEPPGSRVSARPSLEMSDQGASAGAGSAGVVATAP